MDYKLDTHLNIWLNPEYQGISYSDGTEVENRLFNIVQSTADRSSLSEEFSPQISDWATEYHFSRQRHCLIRPLDIQPGDRVLELGCGCGAITRYLGDLGAQVTAVEGSLQRAKIARKRCEELPNVTVFCDNLLNFKLADDFDWVLLIGVLEYAPVFSETSDPINDYLNTAKRHLSETGKLVVAIENQLGLKYFNGRPEDHLGFPFHGINDLYDEHSPITFGRAELSTILQNAGFEDRSFYLPFPDYKLPTVIINHTGCDDDIDFNAGELLSGLESRDYSNQNLPQFSEALSNQVLHRNGLLADLANSFLVVASVSPIESAQAQPLAWYYSIGDRKIAYCTETRFNREHNGEILVHKSKLTSNQAEIPAVIRGDLTLQHDCAKTPYIDGTLSSLGFMRRKMLAQSEEEIAALFLPWFNHIRQFATKSKTDDGDQLESWQLPGNMLDAVPFNTLETGTGFRLFDQEWVASTPIPLGWLLYRAVRWTLPKGMSNQRDVIDGSIVFKSICHAAKLSANESSIEQYASLERALASVVNINPTTIETNLAQIPLAFPAFSEIGNTRRNAPFAEMETQFKQAKIESEQHRAESEQLRSTLELEKARLQSLLEQHNYLCALHAKERHTIVKPILRLGYRSSLKVAKKLPQPIKNRLREISSHLPILRRRSAVTISPPLATGIEDHDSNNDPWRDTILNAKSQLPDIIVFPVIDWHFRLQRPQHLARGLANLGHRVFYLTTAFHHADTPGFYVEASPADNVFIVRLAIPAPHPNIYTTVMTDSMASHIQVAVERMYQTFNIGPAAALIDLPFWRKATNNLPATIQIYDCMDHHAGFSTNEGDLQEQEEQALLQTADVVISSSARLQEKLAPLTNSVLIRNAGEIAFFAQHPESLAFKSDRPVVGYYGAISDWFDMDLLIKAATHFPDWKFMLVGEITHPSPKKAQALKNITFTGEVTYAELPGYLHAFDICVIPFLINELTLCTNPVKIYEYLAAGKPVVTTDMPELRLIDEQCHVKDSHASFLGGLKQAMAECGDQQLAESRAQWASQHDWDQRAELLQNAIENSWPKASVVILTYNNLDFTKACLESVKNHTRYPNLELIIVDNASTDDTPEYLKQYAIEHPEVTVILNEENLGFSAGNNVGLRAAIGDFLVILNNDTYVTDGWLHGLIKHLKHNDKLGLIGPVTNNIGNEAKIDTHYQTMTEMHTEARLYTRKHLNDLLYVKNVAFFCAALSRKVYEKVGEMDENFVLGFFEDDDYCRRTVQEGFEIAIANDVFIHHHLSASFNKLGEKRKQEIFLANKAVYEKKWGKWEHHEHR